MSDVKYQTAYHRKYGKTKKGLISKLYNTQLDSSRRRNHTYPLYTLDEFKMWINSLPSFHSLYENWKDNNYVKRLRPSVDRLDDNYGYSFSNIRLTTWEDNLQKNIDQIKSGEKIGRNKQVHQYTKDGIFIRTYFSRAEASRVTGIRRNHISEVCSSKRLSAGGFKWSNSIVKS